LASRPGSLVFLDGKLPARAPSGQIHHLGTSLEPESDLPDGTSVSTDLGRLFGRFSPGLCGKD